MSATVHWSAPAGDGFSNVTGYVITAWNGAQLVVGDVKSTTFGGLINNESYTFSVAAVNPAGRAHPATNNSVSPTVLGYWLVAFDGGVFSFWNPYLGSEDGSQLVAGRKVRILGADGSPLRQLILDPDQDYQRMP